MEAFELEKEEEEPTAVDFRRFIRTVELNCEKTLLNRKNQLLLKQKNKENWLNRSKIIPPSFAAVHSLPPVAIVLTPSLHSATAIPAGSPPNRSACKTSHRNLRKAVSCERVRSNWKLQFRRDQLNILKYFRREAENIEPDSNGFTKAKRVNKKFEEIKPTAFSLYRTNLAQDEKEDCRERLRTMQSGSLQRLRHIA